MTNQFRLVFKDSPFLPHFDRSVIIASCVKDVSNKMEPLEAVALNSISILPTCYGQISSEILKQFNVSVPNLADIILGYGYPIQTILAAAVCKLYPVVQHEIIYERLLVPTHNFEILRIQDKIFQDLRAAINLLQKDPSGAMIFQFCVDYPFSKDEFFLTGMEIAAITISGLSQELAKAIGRDDWLTQPYDPTSLG